ncbi:sigma-70 family RNA polymerase sigma factor [Microbulbifer sp. GL-2]|uniref:sigma-70 family RNA polymerase sigma factor n=1 Tax=Microbulbifer sp. GL-2 TaxID=2591606 RepID=UPI001165B87A|nr:sigma-70 family RNA polymerase sigma factor [Microbulbifer sp. GL-2]BBM00337.1 RNA polymerase sigma factor FliA [Microbulbifer sp. GL-2]
MSIEDNVLTEMWDTLSRSGMSNARTWLYEYYKDYGYYIAKRIYSRRKFTGVDINDLYQLADVGLIEAIDRYDRTKKVNFKTYAAFRIRGSIANGLESYSERASYYACVNARKQIQQEVNFSDENFESNLFQTLISITLNLGYSYVLDAYDYVDEIGSNESPYTSPEYSSFLSEIMNKVARMSNIHQDVIRMRYFEEASFSEIGRALNLSKTRSAQLHSEAIQLLRKSINSRLDFEC